MTAKSTRRIVEEPLSGYCTQAEVSVRVAETINNGRLNSLVDDPIVQNLPPKSVAPDTPKVRGAPRLAVAPDC